MLFLRGLQKIVTLSKSNVNINISKYRQLRKIAEPLNKIIDDAVAAYELGKQMDKPASRTNEDENLLQLHETRLPDLPKAEKTYKPTFNFAAYVNESDSLQKLLKLGVDLDSIEHRQGLAQFVLKLDFTTQIQPYLEFLCDIGVSPDDFGGIITKNPLIFKEDLEDLKVRVNYLQVKKTSPEQIKRIVTKNPFWLMFSTNRIDKRLGFFQENFNLTGNEVRYLAAKQPKLITYNMNSLRQNTFCVKEEMGFELEEMKSLLLTKPKLFMMNTEELVERFSYIHNTMKLSHHMIVQFPEVLLSRLFRLRERHEFLKVIGRAQYDPSKDLYVSPKSVVEGDDRHFVTHVARCNIKTYTMFLKTR